MQFSSRARRIGVSATLQVARRAAELRAQGVELADFGAGEPDFDTPRPAVEAARRALADGFTRYTPAAGTPELCRSLAARYRELQGAPWDADQVVVTVGAKAALFQLALALFEAGDEVIVPSPCWVSFPEQVRFAGAEPVFVETRAADAFRVDPEAVLARISPRTRAVILNSPSNPTGAVVSAADLERIVVGAAARGVVVVSDETYDRFVYGPAPFASAAALATRFPETVVLVGSFSKAYAMTGWRVGFALGPRSLIQKMIAIQSHATSNVTSFAMVGALAALELCEDSVGDMVAEYGARRALLLAGLAGMPGVSCVAPAGAFYAFPRLSACYGPGLEGSVAMTEFLLERARVVVVPGVAFGADDHVRISFACSRETLTRGLERMAAALAECRPALAGGRPGHAAP